MTTPAPSHDSPGQDNDLQTSAEEKSAVQPAEKGTAEKEPETVQKSKIPEMDEKKEVIDGEEKKSGGDEETPTPGDSEVTRKDMQEESVKAEEDTAAEPASGKEGERSKDEVVVEAQKQEETKSASDK